MRQERVFLSFQSMRHPWQYCGPEAEPPSPTAWWKFPAGAAWSSLDRSYLVNTFHKMLSFLALIGGCVACSFPSIHMTAPKHNAKSIAIGVHKLLVVCCSSKYPAEVS